MADNRQVAFGPFRLDTINECLWHGSEGIRLRPKTYALLCYLVEHPGRLVPQEELMRAVWPDTYVCDAALKKIIAEIRKALGDDAKSPRFIETVHRRGYRFIGRITTVAGRLSLVASESSVPIGPQPATGDRRRATNFVGRESELAQLQRRLEKALAGERQVVFVTGEPGIGKTALVDAFLDIVDRGSWMEPRHTSPESRTPNPESRVWIARGQCLEYHGAGEAYMPVLEALHRLCRGPGRERLVSLLSQHAPMWLLHMPSLISAADLEALQRATLGATRERMLREMAETIEALTADVPLVLLLEDLHWSDYSTLDLISYLAQRREPARLLLIGTYRPEEVMLSGHPLKTVKQELQMHRQCEELPLKFLTGAEVGKYLAARFPAHRFPAGLARLIHQRTDGNPLFMVNLVDYLITQGVIVQRDGNSELSIKVDKLEVGVPESIQQMIERQMDRCSREEQRVLEAASVVGVEFSSAGVAAALDDKADRIEEACEGLARRHHFLQLAGIGELPDGTLTARYHFIHALYQNVFYQRVAATRRAQLHQRVGEHIEQVYGERIGEMAAKLGMHFEQGWDHRRAITYYQQAAENALRRFAEYEAEALARRGLELLKTRPHTPERARQELLLQITLGMALWATNGFGTLEVRRTYTRARHLCQQLGERRALFPALWGLWRCYHIRAELAVARKLAKQLLRLAQSERDSTLLAEAHWAVGATLVELGAVSLALEHLEQGIALHDLQPQEVYLFLYAHNPGAVSRGFGALAQWALGYPDQALNKVDQALALAQALHHPESLADALFFGGWVHQLCRESEKALERAEALIAHAGTHGLVQYIAFGKGVRGWALAMQGQVSKGIEQMHEALAAQRAIGAEVSRLHFLGLLAEMFGEAGQAEEGLTAVAEALAKSQRTGRHYDEAELYRLKGELLLKCGLRTADCATEMREVFSNPQSEIRNPQSEAEACFHQAIEVARRQQAKSFELRAVMSLARLLQKQGRAAEAQQRLQEIYEWFTEGKDTPDLKDAQTILKELS